MSFARHQTFYLRAGWMAKALDELINEERPFVGDQAPVRLGIGRNMVQSLRFWVQASWIAETQSRVLVLTQFGQLVMEYDPYFEEELTWWLIHYYIATREDNATSWYFLFNVFDKQEFSRHSFIESLKEYSDNSVAESSYQKDYDCILASYLEGTQNGSPEENLACPLSQLGLLGQKRHQIIYKNNPSRPIPLEVIYLVMKAAVKKDNFGGLSINVDDLQARMNIGLVFNLSIDSIYRYLDLMDEQGWITFSRTAGLQSIRLSDLDPWELLKNAYESETKGKGGNVFED